MRKQKMRTRRQSGWVIRKCEIEDLVVKIHGCYVNINQIIVRLSGRKKVQTLG